MPVKWILAVLALLVFSLAGIVVLVLVLWWLLRHQKAQLAAPGAEGAELGEVAAEVGPPATDIEVAEIEAPEEQPAEVVSVPDADVGEPALGIDIEAVAPPEEAVPPVADKLERIDGIGPKISGVLQAAGITTFAALAATDVDRLREVLEAESPRLLRLADPATWPEQARFAAAGDWEGLEAFKGTLKGGRRA